ncbi:unnamed protein product [Mytilus coruscus]|uniref:Uncharacterized protein n=1 Tax=Mytilus coruscus TaxID=42192 RepID=A0A6J8BBD2_MYTCO|nr:unnamed protein product [Mytilus coruscus]
MKYRVSAVEYNPSKKTAFKGIPAIGSYSNFQFEEQGIRVWKAHGVVPGLLIAKEKIPTIPFEPLIVLKEPDQIGFHPIIGSKKEDPFIVSESMLNEKNTDGTRRFTYDEILSVQQITSFFSRMNKKGKCQENSEAIRETEICKLRNQILEND